MTNELGTAIQFNAQPGVLNGITIVDGHVRVFHAHRSYLNGGLSGLIMETCLTFDFYVVQSSQDFDTPNLAMSCEP